ncbi:MAG: ABC transporter permease [Firmicutes bacterium]|nr:ABC transporter permease [Bacillota bacterium]
MEDKVSGVYVTAGEAPTGVRKVTKIRFTARNYFPLLALVVLCIVFTIMSPRFLTFRNMIIILQQAVILLVAGLGMTFVILGGSIDLSVGSIVGVTALTAAIFADKIGAAAIIPAGLVGLICGTINGTIFAKGKVPSFIVTLGGLVAYRGIVLAITMGTPVQILNDTFLTVFSGRIAGIPNSVIIGAVVTVLAYFALNNLPFGREVRAVGGGERVAILSGIKVDRVKILMFSLCGVLSGLAGALQAGRTLAATATLGDGMELDVIASVVVGGTPLTGGIGSIQGTVLGTLIITALSNGLNMAGVSPYIQYIVKGLVLVSAVFVTIDRSKIGIIK